MLESILNMIRKLESDIESKRKAIKKLERECDDLLSLKGKLNSAADRHERICARKRSALNNPVLQTSRCMQMFRSSMSDTLNGGKSGGLAQRLSGAGGSVGGKMQSILQEIGDEEGAMGKLKDELEEWRKKLAALTGGNKD